MLDEVAGTKVFTGERSPFGVQKKSTRGHSTLGVAEPSQ